MKKVHSVRLRRSVLLTCCACVSLSITSRPAKAFDYQFDNGVVIRFDNTVQYSLLERAAPESSVFGNNPNENDGDNNLRAGIVGNRLDLLTKLDISDNGYGLDTTVDSFYDLVYNQKTQNYSQDSYNPANEPASKFTSATRTRAGRDIELRNLFLYGSSTISGVPVTVRVGRLVNLYGESLLFAANGISYGQAPIDIERASSVPNTQAKDLFLPVGQVLVSAQLSDQVSVSAYYQFEWEQFNFPPAGSYFSPLDFFSYGGQRLIFAEPQAGAPGVYLYRANDLKGRDTGQFGAALHYDPSWLAVDFGFYALQYNDSEPQVYTHLAGTSSYISRTNSVVAGSYQEVFANGIQIYGASASGTIGPTNYAGEVSVRTHEDLVSSVSTYPGQPTGNNTNNALYATGNVLHYQASALYLGPTSRFWNGSSITAEVAGNNLLGFDSNRQNFNPAYRHMAFGLRSIFAADYYEILPGLDLTPSVGIGWNFMGLSPDSTGFNNTGIDRGGDITFSVGATFRNLWTGSISYTRYIAPPGRDLYADRDFAAFNVERTF